jgi:zinc transport system ATP-binding protein
MPAEETVILRNVNVSYGDIKALEDVNLSVCQHDFLGIIGPNGGGKSTLLKVILGLVQPQTGSVVVMGKAPSKVRNRIGYVSQRFSFDRDFPVSVLDVVIMGHYGRRGLVHRYTKEDRQSAAAALEQVGMLEHRHKQIGKLSGGQQQRVFIARALVAKPELLLLDEPVANIDSTMQTGIYEMLRDLKQRLTIIMVSHDIGAVSIYVDKIACLNQQLYYHGSREITAEILEATYKCPVQLITHGMVPHRVLREH